MKQTRDWCAGNNGPAQSSNEPSGGDPRLARAMEEYQSLLTAGEKPDHGEFLARYPEVAGALADCLSGLDLLHAAAPHLSTPAPLGTPTVGLDAGAPLGDFRLIREVGRGGMGIVYEAEQISLGRRVALKVLPLAATMDARHLQRFHIEARAAAGLHHSNIVPVYGVGCERGVHYFSMQFIDGRTLAEVIAQQRGAATSNLPTVDEHETAASTVVPPAAQATSSAPRDKAYLRQVAEWGIQAAEALDYAHTLGVVHRDVKPANLMVDATGRLWVTDFGLAQVQSDARLTTTGDLLGTLRYMSPEQALAQRVVIDHRTDVYSLGATLYELLTLRPIFNGNDRQELLRQISFDEPIPPRRVNRTLPVELETIVLKALERNPADRYATAKDLADDLRNYCDDRPIRARRQPLLTRVRRWGRRHQALVTSITLVLLTALVLGGVALGWQQRQLAAVEQAVAADLREADLLQNEERWPEALQVLERAAGRLATGGPQRLREGVEQRRKNVAKVAELEEARLQRADLATTEEGGGLDFKGADLRYREALAGYGLELEALSAQEAAQRIRASAIRGHLITALDDWAFVKERLRIGSGEPLVDVARLADDDPWRQQLRDPKVAKDPTALERLAGNADVLAQPPTTLWLLSIRLKEASGRVAAERLLRQAQQRHPADFWINFELGNLLYTEAEAIGFYRASLALRPRSPVVHSNLGTAFVKQGKLTDAADAFRKAIQLKPDYASAYSNLGGALEKQGKLVDAVEACRKAIQLNPDSVEAYNNLGVALKNQGKLAEAVEVYCMAIQLNPDHANAYNNLGVALWKQGKLADAVDALTKAVQLKPDSVEAYSNLGGILVEQGKLADAVDAYRKAIQLKLVDAEAYYNLGLALDKQGKLADAVDAFHKAIQLKPDFAEAYYSLGFALKKQGKLVDAVTAYGTAIKFKPDYVEAYNNLGVALNDQGRLADAVAAYRKAIEIKTDETPAYWNLGKVLVRQNKLAEAVEVYRNFIKRKPDNAEAHCNLGLVLQNKGEFAEALKALHRGHELGSRNARWPYPSAQWIKTCEHLVQLEAKLPAFLSGTERPTDANECLELASLCQLSKHQYAAATRFYSEAFDASPKLTEDPFPGHRYHAACAAALAGCGGGEDAAALGDDERVRLRQKALAWLRDDLKLWRGLLEKEPGRTGPVLAAHLRHWLEVPVFAGVRGTDALKRLPEMERADWQRLWEEVEALRRTAEKPLPTAPEQKPQKNP